MIRDKNYWPRWRRRYNGIRRSGSPLISLGFGLLFLFGTGCQNYRFEGYDENHPVPTPNPMSVRSKVMEGSSAVRDRSAPYPATASQKPSGLIASGVIRMDPALQEKADPASTLYVIVRNVGDNAPPMPLAVKKFTGVEFPLTYEIGVENAMIPDMPLGDAVAVEALFDRDGDPMSKEEGRGVGSFPGNPIKPGTEHVDILLKPSDG